MTRARSETMDCRNVETHHLFTRNVQRAMLCGYDPLTDTDFGYRRDLIRDLMIYLSDVFAVDIGNYSAMGNHLHIIARSRPDIVASWGDEECAWRYRMAWATYNEEQWSQEPTDEHVKEVLKSAERLARARLYLSSLSGFMARLKQPLACRFNREAKTKGHFWEARFGNRRLDVEEDVIGCSIYVDLNHVKAGAASSLIDSTCSGIQDRLKDERAREEWAEQQADTAIGLAHDASHEGDSPPNREDMVEFFRSGWLLPISDDGPLAVEESQRLSLGQVTESIMDAALQGGSTPDETKPEGIVGTQTRQTQRPVGRPPKKVSRGIHQRLHARLRGKRKSDRCFIGTAWSVYRRTVEQLAEAIIGARQSTAPPTDDGKQWRTTPSTWQAELTSFLRQTARTLEGLVGFQGNFIALNSPQGATAQLAVPQHPPPKPPS